MCRICTKTENNANRCKLSNVINDLVFDNLGNDDCKTWVLFNVINDLQG